MKSVPSNFSIRNFLSSAISNDTHDPQKNKTTPRTTALSCTLCRRAMYLARNTVVQNRLHTALGHRRALCTSNRPVRNMGNRPAHVRCEMQSRKCTCSLSPRSALTQQTYAKRSCNKPGRRLRETLATTRHNTVAPPIRGTIPLSLLQP